MKKFARSVLYAMAAVLTLGGFVVLDNYLNSRNQTSDSADSQAAP